MRHRQGSGETAHGKRPNPVSQVLAPTGFAAHAPLLVAERAALDGARRRAVAADALLVPVRVWLCGGEGGPGTREICAGAAAVTPMADVTPGQLTGCASAVIV